MVVEAIVFREDKRFRHHFGVDPMGLGRALLTAIRGERIQGASTITMQLSDLIRPETLQGNQPIKKGSILHKFAQIFAAIGLELRWSKDQILEAYLNLIHLRGEYQGVPALAHAYLDKFQKLLTAMKLC